MTLPTSIASDQPIGTRHRITLSDGVEVSTRILEPEPRSGQNNLGDVLICHGTPWSSHMWLPLARALSSTYRVFLWDMPGYGDSIAEAAVPLDLITQRRRLAELIKDWGLDSPHVIAHDIGGAVALGAHLLEDCDFTSLYLLDIVTLPPWGSPFFQLVAENESVFAALPPRLHQALVIEYIAGAGGENLERTWVEALTRPWCTPAGQDAFYNQIARLRPEHTEPIVDRLDEVRCPVRIGWGADDPWIPAEQAEELARRLPATATVTRFSEAGHLVPLESPDRLEADILRWLR